MSVEELARSMDCGCAALRRMVDGKRMVVFRPCSMICPNYNEIRKTFARQGITPVEMKDKMIDDNGQFVDRVEE